MPVDKHEDLLIENFVQENRRARIRFLVSKPNGRARLRAKFAANFVFPAANRRQVAPVDQTPIRIYELLRELGASDHCHLVSEDTELDGKDVSLRDALNRVIGGGFETIVSCIAGELAFVEGEQGERYVLRNRG